MYVPVICSKRSKQRSIDKSICILLTRFVYYIFTVHIVKPFLSTILFLWQTYFIQMLKTLSIKHRSYICVISIPITYNPQMFQREGIYQINKAVKAFHFCSKKACGHYLLKKYMWSLTVVVFLVFDLFSIQGWNTWRFTNSKLKW